MTLAVRLTVTPPGRPSVVLSGSAPDSPAAVDALTVTWSRPTGRSHAEPGTLKLSVLAPVGYDEAWATWDAEVIAEVLLDGLVWFPVGRGWINTVSRRTIRRDAAPAWLYAVDCIDVLGRANATRLAALPWPQHTRAQRAAAIDAASPAGPLLGSELGSWSAITGDLVPRDVDNANALDIIRRTTDPSSTAQEGEDGIVERRPPAPWPTAASEDGRYLRLLGQRYVVELPANTIEDTGRTIDRTSRVDGVTLTYPTLDPDDGKWVETSETIRATVTRGSASSLKLVTDELGLDTPTAAGQRLRSSLAGLLGESAAAARRLTSTPRIIVDRLTPADIRDLVEIRQRGNNLIRITPRPDDLDALHTVLGGELRIVGRTIRLALDLAPSIVDGIRPLKFIEAREPLTDYRAVFRRPDSTPPTTIRDTTAANIHYRI